MENQEEEKNQFLRTQWLLGEAAMERLKKARVAVFGIGGVGGYVAEALARSGVFSLDLIDKDLVSLTNLNRQIVALHSTVGRPKVDVMKERILDINPQAQVHTYQCFYLPDTRDLFDFSQYDYVVDAVDTVTAKLELISQAKQSGVPIICSMGAGNKKNPAVFEVADISQTSVCPLARVMRQECKKRGLKNVKVVYSKEKPLNSGHEAPASCAFVPSVAGLVIASEVIKDLVAPDKETTR
ncbi:MAG: tRNA threonylcarbamoyladenosine dehydratase [Treponema sp.]|nr:tRNA threonylcarbamoyladenosine dehydratase [Treponema sp.]